MKDYDIRDHANHSCRSYLTSRKIFTSIDGIQSTLRDVLCEVLQGSVLGSILFLIYINDLLRAIGTEHARLFADDASIFLYDKHLAELIAG